MVRTYFQVGRMGGGGGIASFEKMRDITLFAGHM